YRFLGGSPPALPLGLGEQITYQHITNLRQRCFSAEAFQDITNNRCRIRFQEGFDCLRLTRLSGEEMLRWNGSEIFRRVGQLHRVIRLVCEIDYNLIE